MDWNSAFTLTATVSGLVATAVAVAKYFSNQKEALKALHDEVRDLRTQTKVLKAVPFEGAKSSDRSLYQRLLSASSEAQQAVGADLHSISAPVPMEAPTHLRIILSTDPESEKVVGREFPLAKGIAGWVFQQQRPSFQNRPADDPHHFALVDKAAGTRTGKGAILTLPLLTGNACRGVIQFMRTKGGSFDESDIIVATRFSTAIARLLAELQDSSTADIPVVAYGDLKPATILFTDISQFSDVARALRVHDTVALLNEYHTRMGACIFDHGGKLEEYLGDGFYASFMKPVASEAARAAVNAAQQMQAEYRKLLQSWKDYQHPVSDRQTHRIGIGSGLVYSGMIGHPKDRRSKFVGLAVDNAAHFCEDLKEGAIAICPETKRLLPEDEGKNFKKCLLERGEAWVTVAPN